MSRIMPAGEFKAKCLEAMDEVASTGEPIIVTKRGRPVAQIVPITQRPKSLRGFLRGSTEYARLSRPSTTSRPARSPSSDPRTRAVGALAAVALMVGMAFGSPGEALGASTLSGAPDRAHVPRRSRLGSDPPDSPTERVPMAMSPACLTVEGRGRLRGSSGPAYLIVCPHSRSAPASTGAIISTRRAGTTSFPVPTTS